LALTLVELAVTSKVQLPLNMVMRGEGRSDILTTTVRMQQDLRDELSGRMK
jgi:hypothetical protein